MNIKSYYFFFACKDNIIIDFLYFIPNSSARNAILFLSFLDLYGQFKVLEIEFRSVADRHYP